MELTFDQIRQTRKNCYLLMRELSLDQLNTIPENFNNNILWNFGHILITQQLLCYKLCGLELKVPSELVTQFGKGSSPSTHYSQEHLDQLKHLSRWLVDQLEADYKEGVFRNFSEYETSYGLTLRSIEEAISFNALHESMHLGYIMAMKRAL